MILRFSERTFTRPQPGPRGAGRGISCSRKEYWILQREAWVRSVTECIRGRIPRFSLDVDLESDVCPHPPPGDSARGKMQACEKVLLEPGCGFSPWGMVVLS